MVHGTWYMEASHRRAQPRTGEPRVQGIGYRVQGAGRLATVGLEPKTRERAEREGVVEERRGAASRG